MKTAFLSLLALGMAVTAHADTGPATLILRHGDVWTVDDAHPKAEAVAVSGNRIVKVGTDREIMALKGPDTKIIDLNGAFVLPGLIDSHTHFGNAVESFFQMRLVDVNAPSLLAERLVQATEEVPKGMWITGHDWGSAAAVAARKKGRKDFTPFTPTLAEIDRLSPDHPVLLHRYDGVAFVNSRGLALAQIDRNSPDPTNGEYGRDPATGELTGMLFGTAAERVAQVLPPPSRARDLIGARAMLRLLASNGLTGIHDIARIDAISQQKLYATAVERSYTDEGLFEDLRKRGELSVRVHVITPIDVYADYAAHGITPTSGDDWIRFGTQKMFIDGFLMSKPFLNSPGYSGGLSFRVKSLDDLHSNVLGADKLGFDIATHVTGDLGHKLLMDWYEDAAAKNPARDRRFRVIHAWYPAPADVARMGAMRTIIDMQPYHLIRELGSMDEKLGAAQAAYGFPWRSMVKAGARVNLGSDWPGSYDRNHIAPLNPLELIYYAVSRARLDGTPKGGWHREQALTVDEAIRGYTINPAYASREEGAKGSITPGKLADFTILDKNIRTLPPAKIPTAKVLYTLVDGKIIYNGASDAP